MRHEGDRCAGGEDEPDGEEKDGPQIGAKIPPWREERGRVEQRRKEDDEDEFRRNVDARQMGNKAQAKARHDKQHRIGRLHISRKMRERRDDDQQQDDQFEGIHYAVRILPDIDAARASGRLRGS